MTVGSPFSRCPHRGAGNRRNFAHPPRAARHLAQNAALFSVGETVRGVVRSIEPYGVFIELTPNLSGLAEPRADLHPGMAVSVYIKSILPQRMK